MAGNVLLQRVPRLTRKLVTFSASFGTEDSDPAIFNVTGRCLILHLAVGCKQSLTDLAAAPAVISLGPPTNDQEFLPNTTATDIDAGNWWDSASPQPQAGNAITDKVVGPASTTNVNTIILNIEDDDVTAGILEFFLYWLPLSGDGNIAAA